VTVSPADFDVLVVGGGMAGLVFAGLLDEGLRANGREGRIGLLESRPPVAVPGDAPLDLRVSAVAPASREILTAMGAWQALPESRLGVYRRMRVWQEAGQAFGDRSIVFDAAELGATDLGHIVENQTVRAACWSLLEQRAGVELLTGRQPAALAEDDNYSVIRCADDTELTARLIVGADGANSWVRAQLGIEFVERSYGQAGVVAHIATARPHEETAWQRFLSGGPVALLPLADGRSSLVWSCPEAQARQLVETDESSFATELAAALDHVLGDVECTSARASFPLAMGYAKNYTGRRFALLGDAAHRIHPLAGQGANLGLLDAAVLAECLISHPAGKYADPGDPLALRRYERARKGDNLATMRMMDLLNNVFASPLADLAGQGMHVVDRITPVKNAFARYAMGAGRELPAAAQPAAD
jgi:2-octaprenylphenol hydroxylase